MVLISKAARTDELGFRWGANSVHTSRTMMLAELTQVLDRVAPDSPVKTYIDAIVVENVLGKPTHSTRRTTAARLVDLYSLDIACPLFRLLRFFWSGSEEGRPMLAFLLACARDPLLRECTPDVIAVGAGGLVAPGAVAGWLGERYPGRFQATTLKSTAQNLASSWTQAGFLRGVMTKRRSDPRVNSIVVAYSLLLGYLKGLRGQRLLDSPWTSLLDRSPAAILELALLASTQGWLRLKAAGSMVEVTFPGMLTPAEERACREQD